MDHKKLPSHKTTALNEKIENHWQFRIVKDFDNPDDGLSLEIVFEELNGFVSQIRIKKQKIQPIPGAIQPRQYK